MGITTQDSIEEPAVQLCAACGWPGSLFVRNHGGLLVHYDECPEGEYVVEGALIAHDPFSSVEHDAMNRALPQHASLAALERLDRLGHGLTLERVKTQYPVVHESLGTAERDIRRLNIPEVRKRLGLEEMALVGGGPAQEPSFDPTTRYGSKPRDARDKGPARKARTRGY